MSEPSMEEISDYKKVDTKKQKVIYLIIVGAFIVSLMYSILANKYNNSEEQLPITESFKQVPLR